MVSLAALAVFAVVGIVFALAFALVVGALKLVFKVALLPFALVGGLLKVILGVVACVVVLVVGLVAAPLLLALVAVIGIPLAMIGGLFWMGSAVFG